jgi:hypothetical protein
MPVKKLIKIGVNIYHIGLVNGLNPWQAAKALALPLELIVLRFMKNNNATLTVRNRNAWQEEQL